MIRRRYRSYGPQPTIDTSVKLMFKSKEALLEALEARRSWAEKLDVKSTREHAKAELKCVNEFRKRLKDAVNWDYKQLKAHNFEVEIDYTFRPECPISYVSELDNAIAQVKNDGRSKFRITSNNFPKVLFVLTYNENAKQDVCDT